MAVSSELSALLQETFKDSVQESRISEDLRGKVIVIYGSNNLGKTKQASRFKNPIFLPVEKGMNAINGAMTLKTANWGDLQTNKKKLSGRKFVDLLQKGEQITLIIDGVERIGTYCQNYLCQKYKVDDIGKANGGFGVWKEYENLIWTWVDGIIGLGYTIVFIGHEKKDKDKDKFVINGDERNVAPIRDNADIVVYLQSNGVDENNKVIHSSGYLAETEDFFARTRYTYMDTYIEDFTAENLEKIIVDGIKKQNKAEGYDSVDFTEQQGIYGKGKEEDIDDVKSELKNLVEQTYDYELDEDYDDIVEKHLGDSTIRLSTVSEKQLESLICIRNDLKDLIDKYESNKNEEEN